MFKFAKPQVAGTRFIQGCRTDTLTNLRMGDTMDDSGQVGALTVTERDEV